MATMESTPPEVMEDSDGTDSAAATLETLRQDHDRANKERKCMRFSSEGSCWRMGCELVSPVDGTVKFTMDVIRTRLLTGADQAAVEAHLWDSREDYMKCCSKKEVRAKLQKWVEEQRAMNPDFWMGGFKKGPQKLTSTTPVEVREGYLKRMRLARESGKQWAGKRLKDLMTHGHSRSLGLVGKPYIARLLAHHERILKNESEGGEVHPQRAKGKGARIIRLILPEQREIQREINKEIRDQTPCVELFTRQELQEMKKQKKWGRQRYTPTFNPNCHVPMI